MNDKVVEQHEGNIRNNKDTQINKLCQQYSLNIKIGFVSQKSQRKSTTK